MYQLDRLAKKISTVTKFDAAKLKMLYGYMIAQYKSASFEKLKQVSKAPLYHLWNDHQYCDSKWCHEKRLEEQEKAKKEFEEQEKAKKELEEEGKTTNDATVNEDVATVKDATESINANEDVPNLIPMKLATTKVTGTTD